MISPRLSRNIMHYIWDPLRGRAGEQEDLCLLQYRTLFCRKIATSCHPNFLKIFLPVIVVKMVQRPAVLYKNVTCFDRQLMLRLLLDTLAGTGTCLCRTVVCRLIALLQMHHNKAGTDRLAVSNVSALMWLGYRIFVYAAGREQKQQYTAIRERLVDVCLNAILLCLIVSCTTF